MSYFYVSLATAATLGLAGCNIDNPLFGLTSAATDATSAGSEASATQTSEPVTSTTGGVVTGETSIDPQTGGPGTSMTGGGPGTSMTGGSTDAMTGGSTDAMTGGSTDVGSTGETGAAPNCGNGVVEIDDGEECDDGNLVSNDGCSALCLFEENMDCGNGIMEGEEECDAGAVNDDGGSCTLACKMAKCGDKLVWANFEDCDEGVNNSKTGACTTECKSAKCGDGLVWDGVETCDAGPDNGKAALGCSADCLASIGGVPLLIKVLPSAVSADFGGAQGADELCGQVFPGYKAMIAVGVNRVATTTPLLGDNSKDWVLFPYRAYAKGKGELVFVTGKEALLGVRLKMQVPLLNPIAAAKLSDVWTGLNKTWQSSDANCDLWTSNLVIEEGVVGNPLVKDALFIGGAATDCSSMRSLYCVEQPELARPSACAGGRGGPSGRRPSLK